MSFRNLSQIAARCIPAPAKNKVLLHDDGTTKDIVKVILVTAPRGLGDTREFAKYIRGNNNMDTCRRLWDFLKDNIEYKKDPIGEQYIQTPAYTWARKIGDCKSYSIFISSVLKNLGIYHYFRFVSFKSPGNTFTHVYVVVPDKGRQIIMDVVMPEFNTEKKFNHKQDYKMSKIYQMSGIGQKPDRKNEIRFNLGDRSMDDLTEGELDLLIARDRLLTEKQIVEGLRGIGSLKAERYQDNLDLINDALEAFSDAKAGRIGDLEDEMDMIIEDAENGEYRMADSIIGIGSISGRREKRKAKRKARKAKRKAKRVVRKEKRVVRKVERKAKRVVRKEKRKAKGGIISRTGKFLKKAAKGVAKVITAPARLVAKGILEIALPKAAPHFLYLFLTDVKAGQAPKVVQEKRKKQRKIANFITKGIGMKERHFMGIVRNGIMKRYKKSPEAVLKEMQSKKFAGLSAFLEGIFGVGDIGAIRRRRRLPRGTRESQREARMKVPRSQRKAMLRKQLTEAPQRRTFDGDMQASFNNLVKIRDGIVEHTGAKKELLNPENAPSLNDWRGLHIKRPEESKVMRIYNDLPAAGPYFLYLFIKDQETIDKLPPVVKNKRNREKFVSNYLSTSLNISQNELLGQFRKGIVARFGKNPEDVIKDQMHGRIAGIGVIPIAAAGTLITIIKKIAGFLKKRFKKEDLESIKADQPGASDWDEMDKEQKLEVERELEEQFDMEEEFRDGARSIWDTLRF
ncbi:hypothetical protein ES705_06384 [subsurface metagenome]